MKIKKPDSTSKICVFLTLIILFSNLAPITASNLTVSSDMNNSDIQKLIDNSSSGDTIIFNGSSYSNISLIIDRKLNILSINGTNLIGNDMRGTKSTTETDSFVFLFTGNGKGSSLSGFNIFANSDYGVIVNNVKNLLIANNNILGGFKGSLKLEQASNVTIKKDVLVNSDGNGIFVKNSNGVNIINNSISNNSLSGIYLLNSDKVNINSNTISKNVLSGIKIESSNYVNLFYNIIKNNGFGIYLENTYAVNITRNDILHNNLNGITLEGTTQNTYISHNNILYNLNGIYLDSYSINDQIVANVIGHSFISTGTYLDVFETGNGIGVGSNYQKSNTNVNVENNAIIDNERFSIKSNPQYDDFTVGANWFGSNNAQEAGTCPMVSSCMLLAKLTQTSNGTVLSFYSEKSPNIPITDMANINAIFLLNGEKSQIIQVVNGTARFNYPMDTSKENIVTVLIGNLILNLNIDANSQQNQNNNSNTGNGTENSNGTDTNGTGGSNNSNSTGNNGTGSGTSTNSTLSGNEQGTTQVGVNGESGKSSGGSSANGQKATEVSVKDLANSIKENPFTNLGIIALLGLIGFGYFKRDKIKK